MRLKKDTGLMLKAMMKKAGIQSMQLTYSDFEKVKEEKVKISSWKSGLLAEEIIDIEYINNEITY